MPRLLDATRQDRRDRIADAAMACFARQGFAGTSMADVIAESGASAGSIYSHFDGKLDLARYAAGRILVGRTAQLEEALRAAEPGYLSPQQVLQEVLGAGTLSRDRARLLLQLWAESAHDETLGAMVTENLADLRRILADALLPWARATRAGPDPTAVADREADALLALSHGYAVRIAVDRRADDAPLLEALIAH